MSNCIYCKSNDIEICNEEETISYKEKDLKVFMLYTLCHLCGKEFVPKDQILVNDARVRDAKKVSDGLLSSKEIYLARMELGITQEEAAIIFGGGKNAFSKYERAEVSQSTSMDKLIKVALKYAHVFLDLVNEENLTLKNKWEKSKPIEKKVLIARNSELPNAEVLWAYGTIAEKIPAVANDDIYHIPAGYVSVRKDYLGACGYE